MRTKLLQYFVGDPCTSRYCPSSSAEETENHGNVKSVSPDVRCICIKYRNGLKKEEVSRVEAVDCRELGTIRTDLKELL